MMAAEDLAALAAELKREGYEARNLGGVGITIWIGGQGRFFSAGQLAQYAGLVARRDFEGIARATA